MKDTNMKDTIIKPLLCKTILAYIKCLAFSNTISYI